jgi:hypothetical protein
MSGVDVTSLGCVPMNATGGTSAAVATNNATFLNGFLATTWRGAQRPLFFPAAGWLVDSPVVISLPSTKIEGGGAESFALADDAYTMPLLGGPSSRLVADSQKEDPPSSPPRSYPHQDHRD